MLNSNLRRLLRNFSQSSSFKASDIKITRVENRGLNPSEPLIYGKMHSAHMFQVESVNGKWSTPEIVPYAPLSLDPFNSTLHYALTCFEGMKAYLDKEDQIRLFRPEQNMNRFLSSCRRLSLAEFDTTEMLKCLEEYVKVERNWIPKKKGEALYLRPFAFSTENTLGVKVPTQSRIMIVASPVGNYFGSELKPITLGTVRDFERGTPHSAAGFKLGSNYAPTIKLQGEIEEKTGADQILWLYKDKILEAGTCNIFFLIKNDDGELELCTAPLDGSILPGITRSSILGLEKEKGRFKVSERFLTIQDLKRLSKEDRLIEIFGAGTSVIVLPVRDICKLRFI